MRLTGGPVSFKDIHFESQGRTRTPFLIAETADLDHLSINREYRRLYSFSTQFTYLAFIPFPFPFPFSSSPLAPTRQPRSIRHRWPALPHPDCQVCTHQISQSVNHPLDRPVSNCRPLPAPQVLGPRVPVQGTPLSQQLWTPARYARTTRHLHALTTPVTTIHALAPQSPVAEAQSKVTSLSPRASTHPIPSHPIPRHRILACRCPTSSPPNNIHTYHFRSLSLFLSIHPPYHPG